MEEKKNDNRKKCPVCGRFCKAEAVDRYNGLLNDRNRLSKELDGVCEELNAVRKSLVESQMNMGEAVKQSGDYEALYIDTRNRLDKCVEENKRLTDKLADAGMKLVATEKTCSDLRSENERLMKRGFWARVFNKQV